MNNRRIIFVSIFSKKLKVLVKKNGDNLGHYKDTLLKRVCYYQFHRLDEFISEHIDHQPITDDLIKRIKKTAIDAPFEHPEKSDDELIYGL